MTRATECTTRLVAALNQARALDLDKLHASGINVELQNYTTGALHVERVTLSPEFCGPLKAALVEALEKTLAARLQSLEWQARDARKALNLEPKA